MRTLVAILGFALHSSFAIAAPMDLPEPVRVVLAAARTAQKESRNQEAIELGRAGIARLAVEPAVQAWHLAPLLRTMAEAYEQTGARSVAARTMSMASLAIRQAPDKHDDLRRWFAAEAARKLLRVGALAPAREHMDFAVRDIVSFVARAEESVVRETAIETLLDDVELSLEVDDRRMAQLTLALARHLMVVHDISDQDLLIWYERLLERATEVEAPDNP